MQSRTTAYALWAAYALLAIAVTTWHWINTIRYPESSDFTKFYWSAKRFTHNLSPYWPHACKSKGAAFLTSPSSNTYLNFTETDPDCLHPNLNPPIFVLIIKPLAYLTFEAAALIWLLGSVIAYLFFFNIVYSIAIPNATRNKKLLLTTASLAFFPTYLSLDLGQVTPFLALVISRLYLDLKENKTISTSLYTAFLISIKPFFATFLPFLVIFRRTDILAITLIAIALINGTAIFATDVTLYRDYLTMLPTVDWLHASWNSSIAGFLSRILHYTTDLPTNTIARHSKLLSFALFLLFILYLTRKNQATPPATIANEYIFHYSIISAITFSPLGWIYYYPLLSISVARTIHPHPTITNNALLITSVLLSTIPYYLRPLYSHTDLIINNIYFASIGLLLIHLIIVNQRILSAHTKLNSNIRVA